MPIILKPLDVVEVRDVQVTCSNAKINDILGCIFQSQSYLKDLMHLHSFENVKVWLALLIRIPAPSWLKERAIIEKKELNIPARFWFRFISSNLISS